MFEFEVAACLLGSGVGRKKIAKATEHNNNDDAIFGRTWIPRVLPTSFPFPGRKSSWFETLRHRLLGKVCEKAADVAYQYIVEFPDLRIVSWISRENPFYQYCTSSKI